MENENKNPQSETDEPALDLSFTKNEGGRVRLGGGYTQYIGPYMWSIVFSIAITLIILGTCLGLSFLR